MDTPKHPLTVFREAQVPPLSTVALASDLDVADLTVKRWEACEVLPRGTLMRAKIKRRTGLSFGEFVAFWEENRQEAAA